MRILTFILAALLSFGVANSQELSKKDLKQIEKDAKKAMKDYKDWKVLPGALPIQRQLEESYKLHYLREDGEPAYIVEDGVAVAGSYNAAKLQAVQAAKLKIAAAVETEIAAIIEGDISNQEINTQEAATISKVTSASKAKIAQSLGRTNTVVELYQELPNKNVRVMVFLSYSNRQAREVGKKVILNELSQESEKLKNQLDKIVNW